MRDTWRCPNCRRSHAKTFTYGAVTGRAGNMVARQTFHPDARCECGATFGGNEILGGLYDDPPLRISALVRIIIAGPIVSLAWAGIAYWLFGTKVAIVVGLVVYAVGWLAYFSGQVKDFEGSR